MEEQRALQIFNFEGHGIRIVMINNQPWWVAKDICDFLEIQNSRQAAESLDEDEREVSKIYTPGGEQEMTIISESGVFSLVLRSRKPDAKRFKKYLTTIVIPSILKYGFSGINRPELRNGKHGTLLALIQIVADKVSADVLEQISVMAAGSIASEEAERVDTLNTPFDPTAKAQLEFVEGCVSEEHAYCLALYESYVPILRSYIRWRFPPKADGGYYLVPRPLFNIGFYDWCHEQGISREFLPTKYQMPRILHAMGYKDGRRGRTGDRWIF